MLILNACKKCLLARHNCAKLYLSRYKSKKYSDTLCLPKTDFPLTMKDGFAVKRESELQKVQ